MLHHLAAFQRMISSSLRELHMEVKLGAAGMLTGEHHSHSWSLQNQAGDRNEPVTRIAGGHKAGRAALVCRDPRRDVVAAPTSPMICGKEPLSRSSSTVPVCRQVRSSKRLCRDSVDTWGLLQRSPPSSTFSSNFIHLEGVRMGFSMASPPGGGPTWVSPTACRSVGSCCWGHWL